MELSRNLETRFRIDRSFPVRNGSRTDSEDSPRGACSPRRSPWSRLCRWSKRSPPRNTPLAPDERKRIYESAERRTGNEKTCFFIIFLDWSFRRSAARKGEGEFKLRERLMTLYGVLKNRFEKFICPSRDSFGKNSRKMKKVWIGWFRKLQLRFIDRDRRLVRFIAKENFSRSFKFHRASLIAEPHSERKTHSRISVNDLIDLKNNYLR